jgi:hypothetical protein
LSNKWGWLAQAIHNCTAATNTVDFIPKSSVPTNKKVMYGNFIYDYCPFKSEKYRVRLTAGGDRLEYNKYAGSPDASLLETKLIINSTISNANNNVLFLCAGLKDFFLATVMEDPELMQVKYKYFLINICQQYNINTLVSNDGYMIHIKIKKCEYGLKQAAVLAYNYLVKHPTLSSLLSLHQWFMEAHHPSNQVLSLPGGQLWYYLYLPKPAPSTFLTPYASNTPSPLTGKATTTAD